MPNHGDLTFVSYGTKAGVWRPQVRLWYRSAKHGLLFDTITKPIRCRTRQKAVSDARKWARTDEFLAQLETRKAVILRDPANTL